MDWLKQNKVLVATIVILFFFILFLRNTFFGINTLSLETPRMSGSSVGQPAVESFGGAPDKAGISPPTFYQKEYTPQSDSANRLVVQESNLSLLVKDVVSVRNKILSYTSLNGGYMVSASTSNPQDAPTSTISVRVPAVKLQESLDYFHSLSVKVVSENLLGQDVTDEYIDIDTRILQVQKTMDKLEAILSEAKQISDITNLTQQILSYQNQIDSLKGQKLSLEKNAELAKLTIYLSTDEIALPYAPTDTFRPAVIFKLAVRSLVGGLRGIAASLIWIIVYAVIWVPLLIIFVFLKKYYKNWKAKNSIPQINK